ncbi:MAG: HlyD family efflux transporter periplasmic adaptor subunit [Paracoccaceae bacterium]|nr:HlyD family efflux transporter periplasmic adaptor subunit [Paracoccaceae bacterium]
MLELPRQIFAPLRMAALAVIIFLGGAGLWSALAPIATTLRISGTLVSTKPSFDIQHPFGGLVTDVLVSLHQSVDVGETLLILDTETQDKTLKTIREQIAYLEAENEIITSISSDEQNATGNPPSVLDIFYQERSAVLALRLSTKSNAIEAKKESAHHLSVQMDLVKERILLLAERSNKQKELSQRGFLSKAELDTSKGQILVLEGALEDQSARLAAINSEIRVMNLELKSMVAEDRLSLSEKAANNLKNVPQLKIQAFKLEQEINAARINAPVDGQITIQNVIAPSMVAQAGQTLMTLSLPLFEPKVTLKIPVANIDQVAIGQTGKLTLTPLSQRDAPDIEVTVIKIAPQATLDPEQNPLFYLAEARLNESDLEVARQNLGDRFRLATDMPVSVALKGRDTTFAQFLFKPFIDIFSTALQDS